VGVNCIVQSDLSNVVVLSFSRHAVVHPWGPNPGPDAPGKELYLIPIMPHEVLPEYVEILDLVKFPKQRDEKILLGVFVLNKGKFSEWASPAYIQPQAPISEAESNSATTLGATSSTGQLTAPVSRPAQMPAVPPEIVSKLTPQQVESLLQSVLSGGLNSMPLAQSQQPLSSPTPATFPPSFPASLATLLPQQYPATPFPAYSAGIPSSAQYPPPQPQPSPPMPYGYTTPNMLATCTFTSCRH